MAIDFNQIGSINMDLVLALKNGETHAAGFPVSDYLHDKAYNYDLSYGLHGIANKRALSGTYVGVKYYCYNAQGINMKKRLVHIYDPKNADNPQTFYILVHTAGQPGLRDNSYSNCDLVTNIP
jgi:hypothetical protein